jgi:hypothetical protein
MEVSVYFLVILKENLILSGKWQSCGFHATSSGWWGALEAVMDLVLADRQVHGHVPCPQALPL